MKQLILILLIILVTVMSWSSCAKNEAINLTKMYRLSPSITSPSLFTTTLTELETNDSLNFHQAKVVTEHNRFFELSIVFNENLQQMISLFTRSENKKRYTVSNSFPSYTTKKPTVEACEEG